MLSIHNGETLSRVLNSSTDKHLKRILRLRRDQLGGDINDQVHFVIAQPPDRLGDIERVLGFTIEQDRGHGPEWAEDHGSLIELCWIFTDDGFAHVLIVPKIEDIDAELLELSGKYASETA